MRNQLQWSLHQLLLAQYNAVAIHPNSPYNKRTEVASTDKSKHYWITSLRCSDIACHNVAKNANHSATCVGDAKQLASILRGNILQRNTYMLHSNTVIHLSHFTASVPKYVAKRTQSHFKLVQPLMQFDATVMLGRNAQLRTARGAKADSAMLHQQTVCTSYS